MWILKTQTQLGIGHALKFLTSQNWDYLVLSHLQKVAFSWNSCQSQTLVRGPALSTQSSVQFSVSRQGADNSLSDTDAPSFAQNHEMFNSRTV